MAGYLRGESVDLNSVSPLSPASTLWVLRVFSPIATWPVSTSFEAPEKLNKEKNC